MDDALRSLRQTESAHFAVTDRIDEQLQIQRTALKVRAYRQELLASNIANADTPNYKARDIDFKATLAAAVAGRSEGAPGLARTSPRHFGDASGQAFGSAVKYRTEYQPNADGNTVNMDIERAAFAENALQMEVLLTSLRGQLSTLQTAIQNTP